MGDLPRTCLGDPIPEIFEAARFLDAAVSAHTVGQHEMAHELIRLADIPAIAEWGKDSPWSRPLAVDNQPDFIPKEQRLSVRMPSSAEKRLLLKRDGFHCRFCGIPVVRAEARERIRKTYPEALRWGTANHEQHAAFQAMWVQYDHIVPHARGGTNDPDNMLVTCAPCNYGRAQFTLEEVGISDPRLREPIRTNWDGLERFSGAIVGGIES